MRTKQEWSEDQVWERKSWGDNLDLNCGEANKQIHYANLMKINIPYDAKNKSIIDFGCGPVSMLLRVENCKNAVGIEPIDYGENVNKRYQEKKIKILQLPIEEYEQDSNFLYNEAWMYNVLQHVIDPVVCLQKINKAAKTIRIFEWIDMPSSPGHPHVITKQMMIENLELKESEYFIVDLNENELCGKAIIVLKNSNL